MCFPDSSLSSRSTAKLGEPFENEARMKLRDYLFLTKTAANKIASEKKKQPITLHSKTT